MKKHTFRTYGRNWGKALLSLGMALLILANTSAVNALARSDIQSILNNTTYFAPDDFGNCQTTGGNPTANDVLLSMRFVNLGNEDTVAANIMKMLQHRSPHSPWLQIPDFGHFAIAEAKKVNVNPLVMIAIGGTESGFGTTGRGVPHHNAFGWNGGDHDSPTWPQGYIDFANFIDEALNGQHAANYTKVRTIYEYFSVHQTGGIYYPGNNHEINGAGPDFPIHDPKMNVDVSWQSPYNPLVYYKSGISIINEIMGTNFPVDNPPIPSGTPITQDTNTSSNTAVNSCPTGNGTPLPAGADGYDLPGETGATHPMVYYSQQTGCPGGNHTCTASTKFFGNQPFGVGTFDADGCAPTSLAMIIATLTGNGTEPPVVGNWIVQNHFQESDGGTNSSFLNTGNPSGASFSTTFGVTWGTITPEQIADSLRAGKLVLIGVNVSAYTHTSNPNGHYMVIRKVEGTGVDAKFYFADPFRWGWAAYADSSLIPFDYPDVANMIRENQPGAKNLWAFSKM